MLHNSESRQCSWKWWWSLEVPQLPFTKNLALLDKLIFLDAFSVGLGLSLQRVWEHPTRTLLGHSWRRSHLDPNSCREWHSFGTPLLLEAPSFWPLLVSPLMDQFEWLGMKVLASLDGIKGCSKVSQDKELRTEHQSFGGWGLGLMAEDLEIYCDSGASESLWWPLAQRQAHVCQVFFTKPDL